ncbi:ribbon-helix-helix protein, CopG family [bacterium]|nr:MAG: ribbon-helix-helix protein, CopG family [bacterium]
MSLGLKAGRPSDKKPTVSLSDLKGKTVRLNVDIDKELHKKLKRRAIDEERTVTDFVRELLSKSVGE